MPRIANQHNLPKPKPRGRPRDPGLDDRILDATLEALAAEGYRRMSLESIARRAGVTKPTLYRRWRGKEDIATSALARLQQSASRAPSSDLRADLVEALRDFRQKLLRPNGMAMIGTLLTEERATPRLLELFRDRVVAPRRTQLAALLEAARARGELRPNLDVEAAVTMIVGSFYAQYLADGRIPDDWPERVVDTLAPLLAREPQRPAPPSGVL